MMNDRPPRPTVGRFGFFRELLSMVFFGVGVFTLLQLASPQSIVQGRSMQPTFEDGQRLLISRVNYMLEDPHYGEIIVFNSPDPLTDGEPPLIKRVIGMPNDTIEIIDTQVYRNGELLEEPYINEPCTNWKCPDESWELGPTEYFMMGDNRNHSNDSRSFGPVDRSLIIGEAIFRFWPLDELGSIHKTRYPE
jgi:signal peptidase I